MRKCLPQTWQVKIVRIRIIYLEIFKEKRYLDKFLLGKEDGASTEALQFRFTCLDTEKWIPWKIPELK